MIGRWLRHRKSIVQEGIDLGLPAWSLDTPQLNYRRRHCTHPTDPFETGMAVIESGRFEATESDEHWAGEEAYNYGVVLMERGDIDGAIEKYKESIVASPDHPSPRSNLGIALIQRGEREAGLDQLRAAIELDQNDAGLIRNLAVGLRASHEHDTAIELLEEAAQRDPTESDYASLLAIAHGNDEEQTERALYWARRAVELDPEEISYADNLGTRLNMAGRHEEAIEWFERAIELDPHHPLPYYNLGAACRQAGELETAERAFRKHIQLEPEHSCAFYELARVRSELEDEAAAKALFEQYRTLEPTDPAGLMSMGISNLVLGDLQLARDDLHAALEMDPGLHWAVYSLGKVALQQGDRRGAEAYFREALRRDPEMDPAFGRLIDILVDEKRDSELIELAAQNPSGRHWPPAVDALAGARRLRSAEIAARRCIAQHQEDGWPYPLLAQVLEDRKRFKDALEQWHEAQKRNPQDPRPPLNMGRVLAHLNRIEPALAALQASIDMLPEGEPPSEEHLTWMAWCHTKADRIEKARPFIEQLAIADPGNEWVNSWLKSHPAKE